jgi:hypothetical protein
MKNFRITSKNSVEHVIPQNPEYLVSVEDDTLEGFGNLALLSVGQNSSYSNQDPSKKKRSAEVQPSSMVTTDGKVGGYKYQDAPIPDIIAYCFGGEKNQEKLKNIIDNAKKIDDNIEKKTFIENQVRAHAGEIDKGIGGGMIDFFSKAQERRQFVPYHL